MEIKTGRVEGSLKEIFEASLFKNVESEVPATHCQGNWWKLIQKQHLKDI